jgi:hypothetical protein
MSIYATLWEMKLRRAHSFDTDWVTVYAQAVPAHIGHPSEYPDGDPYSDFLPPVVEYDPETGNAPYYRAVVILMEGKDEKVVQQYTTPLLVLTGAEYARTPFPDLMRRIENAMPRDRSVVGMFIGPNGESRLLRRPERADSDERWSSDGTEG